MAVAKADLARAAGGCALRSATSEPPYNHMDLASRISWMTSRLHRKKFTNTFIALFMLLFASARGKMSRSAQALVAKAFLRSILRGVRALDKGCKRGGLNAKLEILSRVPTTSALRHLRLPDAAIPHLVVAEFRTKRGLTNKEDISEALSDASRASRRIWGRANIINDTSWPGRHDGVQFHVGQVATHKLYGYRFAIAGWTAKCDADPSWVAANGVDKLPLGTKQPFYNCLVDERDRPGAQVTYVAQENILPSTAPAPILHRGVEAAFEAWQPGLGYVPCHEVQELYPEDAFVGSALAHSNAAGGTVDAGPLEAHLPPVRPTYAQAKADADAAAAARE